MDSEIELRKAIKIINNLVDGLAFLPLTWDDMICVDVSDDIKEFMQKHDPDRWST